MSMDSAQEQETAPQGETQQRVVQETLYEYLISWKWLLGGLVALAVLGGGLAGLYFVRYSAMPDYILDTAKKMVAEAEEAKKTFETTADSAEKTTQYQKSVKLRTDAANILNSYRQANQNVSDAALEELYEILNSLYVDQGQEMTLVGSQRGKQLIDLCVVLVRSVREAESIKYRTRLVELEWDRRDFAGIIERAKDLLRADQAVNGKENYDALRYITLAAFERLTTTGYNPLEMQLPAASFPREMDDLLKKLYIMKPDDINVAARYAEFIADVKQEAFSKCATENLLKMPDDDRRQMATKIINDMVSRNPDNVRAYLVRYHFNDRYNKKEQLQDRENPDLLAALKIQPGNPEALILSSREAFRQSAIARRDKKMDEAKTCEERGQKYLERTIKENPGYGSGYQYYGDYLLSKGKDEEAIKILRDGLKNAFRWQSEELIGRIASILIRQQKISEAKTAIDSLAKVIAEMRVNRQQMVPTVNNMRTLLTAQLYFAESAAAQAKIEKEKPGEENKEETRKVFTLIQQRRNDAMQMLDDLLKDFGSKPHDYIIERESIYSRLLPQSLILAGRLKMDSGIWDSAVAYFRAATGFPEVREQAMIEAANAYQQGGRLEDSTQILAIASKQNPDNLPLRFAYASSLFRSQLAVTVADPAALDEVKKELDNMEKHRSEMRQPWVIDIRLVHLELVRSSLSNNSDVVLAAQQKAVKEFQKLESKTFPPDAEGKERNYIDDMSFVTELVGIYSGLSAIADFDRLLPKLREFPDGGESAYYAARVNDCLRRDDREGAIAVIEEANASPKLLPAQKDRYVTLLQNLKGGNKDSNSLEKVYTQLKTTFDQNPETLKPQAFFLLANMAIDREDWESAKMVRDRLEKLEGQNGTMWRYIGAQIQLSDSSKAPDFEKLRQTQEDIIKERPGWDMAYLLRASIEEKFLEANPDDVEAKAKLVDSLQMAVRNGNSQPAVWSRLSQIYEADGRTNDARDLVRNAALRGIMLDSQTGQFPQPYSRMYTQVQEAILNEDAANADMIARQCITLAEKRHEKDGLIFSLNMTLGKAFFDAKMYDSAKRHLLVAAGRGGTYVYPLAVCYARAGEVDRGYSLLLDEINMTPSSMPTLLPSILVLLTQIKPGEPIFQRIDRLMNRVERGEPLILRSELEKSDEDSVIPLGVKRIRTLSFRFPDSTTPVDPNALHFLPPTQEENPQPTPATPTQPVAPEPAAPTQPDTPAT